MFLFLGLVKNVRKKKEISVERLHSIRIGCLMKDSSYGFKSQKVNIKLYVNFAITQLLILSSWGVSALASHAKGTKHQGKVKAFKPISELFYKTSTSITTWSASSTNSSVASSGSSSTNQSNNLSTNQSRVHTFMSSLSVTPAEIQSVMKMLMSHSFRFCLDLNELLKAMFPDSQIAKLFRLSKTKCSYYLVFGLAPLKKL